MASAMMAEKLLAGYYSVKLGKSPLGHRYLRDYKKLSECR
jgi:hypothetical protein